MTTRPGDGGGEEWTYAAAGVDLDAADKAVALLAGIVDSATRPEVLGGIGGFGGLFAFDPARYTDPVLVSSADGVGTKVEIARRLDTLDTIGQDAVAMVADDVVVCGAEPLFVNDYLAVGRLVPERVARIVAGVAEGCRLAGCALVGGETAEHPGVMGEDAFDLAAFCVGVVDRHAMLGPHRVGDGDVLVAMASNGLHSNGYSLVRRVVAGLDLADQHGLDRPLGEALTVPTRIYARDCLALAAATDVRVFCHVTGGGLVGNLPRVLPPGAGAEVDASSWEPPEIFGLLQSLGHVADEEMWRTFNMGVGMVAIVAERAAGDAVDLLRERDVPAWVMGRVVGGSEVVIRGRRG